MQAISSLSRDDAGSVEILFTDIDGTLTDPDGRIPAAVFAAMEASRDAGIAVVPITGRPAGWCDLIARTWPVDAVVGENGGLYFRRGEDADGQEFMQRIYAQDAQTRAANRAKLERLQVEVLAAVPGAGIASDQSYREFDLAVDFREDVAPLTEGQIDEIVATLRAAGCTVKVSNIHVNAWFGDFDKATMCRRYLREIWGRSVDGEQPIGCVFFGDSPNDAPLFRLFPLSIGVANVRRMADRIEHLPRFVTKGEGGSGFVEAVDLLLSLRGEGC